MYDNGWEGWHANCLCAQRRDTAERFYIQMNSEYAAVIAQCVANGQIGVADKLIDAWVGVNISMEAKWKWGRKFNTHSFSPKSGKVTNFHINSGFYRDLADVWVPWCAHTSYRIIMR
jgi:hypothetical protein